VTFTIPPEYLQFAGICALIFVTWLALAGVLILLATRR
jgi:hypothetical protein